MINWAGWKRPKISLNNTKTHFGAKYLFTLIKGREGIGFFEAFFNSMLASYVHTPHCQTDRQTNRQTDTHTHTHTHI